MSTPRNSASVQDSAAATTRSLANMAVDTLPPSAGLERGSPSNRKVFSMAASVPQHPVEDNILLPNLSIRLCVRVDTPPSSALVPGIKAE
jgi:hypothetical protein